MFPHASKDFFTTWSALAFILAWSENWSLRQSFEVLNFVVLALAISYEIIGLSTFVVEIVSVSRSISGSFVLESSHVFDYILESHSLKVHLILIFRSITLNDF